MLAAKAPRALSLLSRSSRRVYARVLLTRSNSSQAPPPPRTTTSSSSSPTPAAKPAAKKPKPKPAYPRVPPGYLPSFGPSTLPTPAEYSSSPSPRPASTPLSKLSPDARPEDRPLEPGGTSPTNPLLKTKRHTTLPQWTVPWLLRIAPLMGYYSPKMKAIRETRWMYRSAVRQVMLEDEFFVNDCRLPPTFQTWFALTNLYVWLLTVRLRALPPPHGKLFVAYIVNNYFADAEDRMRIILTPRCPERILRGHLNDIKAQWAGATLSYDLALIKGDAALAGAIWRNIFDARGGKELPDPGERTPPSTAVSRTPTAPPSTAVDSDPAAADADTDTDAEADPLDLPHLLYLFTAFLRRETKRLERIPDEQVLLAEIGTWGWIDPEPLRSRPSAGAGGAEGGAGVGVGVGEGEAEGEATGPAEAKEGDRSASGAPVP